MLGKMQVNKKRILYIICFFLFCLIDQRTKTGSGLDGVIETFRNLTGVVMATIILSHYHWKDFVQAKVFHLGWTLIGAVVGSFFIVKGQNYRWFLNDRLSLTLAVFLWGHIVILTAVKVFNDKARKNWNRLFFCLWLVMMGLMCVSRSTYHWPAAYLIMFGAFYLTDYTKEEQDQLFQGMLDGVILGFFVLQGWCFAFRPYDDVRYVGVHNNCNLNAQFYLIVLAAALTKLYITYKYQKVIWLKLYYWAGVGSVLGFLFMTVSRTGWAVAAVMVFMALLFMARGLEMRKKVVSVAKNGVIVVLCFVLLFPAVFGAVRYLPPVFHHPVWFFGEWSEDKVHSWDPWDSEKFVDFDELMYSANKRVMIIVKGIANRVTPQENITPEKKENSKTVEVSPLQQQLYDEALAAGYALPPNVKSDAITVRKAIYRYYIHLLNFTGRPESEQGFQMTRTHRIGHAHNIYLQYGVDFGIPVMILFAILVWWTILKYTKDFWKKGFEADAGCVLLLLVIALFGMLEYAWGVGSLTTTLLFVIWRRMIYKDVENGR